MTTRETIERYGTEEQKKEWLEPLGFLLEFSKLE